MDNEKTSSVFSSVYNDATYFVDSIVNEYDIFQTILDRMRNGNASLELRKRYLLRAIDEAWVNAVEEALPALDTILRNPSKFIEEKEEILPVEMTKKVTVRTLQHLSQHTDYISRITEDGMVIPSKLLNVYKEETLQTYENKFVNTLINRLYLFVSRRYEIAKKTGLDEKTTSIEFKDGFDHDNIKVNMNFRIEISEKVGEEDKIEKNYSYTTDLWHRVQRLNGIVTEYANSEFVRSMEKSYIRPPVMKTNAILKNKNLHQCLTLWQFIENYEDAGYSMLIQENLEDVDESYIKELYSTLALQYMIFRYNIKNEFEVDNTLASGMTEGELKPKIVDELTEIKEEEFLETTQGEKLRPNPSETRYGLLTPEDRNYIDALDIALDASDIIRANGEEFIYSMGNIQEPEDEIPVNTEDQEENSDEESVISEDQKENNEEKPIIPETQEENSNEEPVISETQEENSDEKPVISEDQEENSDEKPVIPETQEENSNENPENDESSNTDF